MRAKERVDRLKDMVRAFLGIGWWCLAARILAAETWSDDEHMLQRFWRASRLRAGMDSNASVLCNRRNARNPYE
jgi:hypothetical protein